MFSSLLVLRHGSSKLDFELVMITLMPNSSGVIYGLKLLSIYDKIIKYKSTWLGSQHGGDHSQVSYF